MLPRRVHRRVAWPVYGLVIFSLHGCHDAPGSPGQDDLDGPNALLERLLVEDPPSPAELRPVPDAERQTLREILERVDPDLLEADLEAYGLESRLDEVVPVFLQDDEASQLQSSSDGSATMLSAAPRAVASGDDLGIPAGDVGCATVALGDPAIGASVPLSPAPSCSVATDTTASPDAAGPVYGPTSTCPLQYVTEITGTLGRDFSFTFDLPRAEMTVDPYASEAACESIRVDVTAFGAKLLWPPLQVVWVELGTTHFHGVWSGGRLSTCLFQPSASQALSFIDEAPYFKVRAAARAYEASQGLYWFRPIEVGAVQIDGPC